MRRTRCPTRARSSRGAAAVEAVLLVLVVLVPLFFGALDLGRVMWVKIQLNNAAQQGAAFAAVAPRLVEETAASPEECDYGNSITDHALKESSEIGALTGAPTVQVRWGPTRATPATVRTGCNDMWDSPGKPQPGSIVEVRVTGEVRIITPGVSSFFSGNAMTISGVARARVAEGY